MKRLRMLALVCSTILTLTALAQQQDTLKEINRKIEILTEELERLKVGEISDEQYEVGRGLGPAAAKVYQLKKTGVSIAGYGEVTYENYAQKREDNADAGKADKVDYLRNVIYVGFRYNDWIVFNSEVEFEHANTGKGGEVSVEFGYVEFMLSKGVNIRAGMILPPVGIINEKHEPSTFLGTLRPQVERSIIPSTWRTNGVGAYGEFGPWNYRAYVVEGFNAAKFTDSDGLRGGRQSGASAIAEDLGLTGKLEFAGIPGSILGTSFYFGNSGQGARDSLGRIKARTALWSIHAEHVWKGIELRALYAAVSLDDVGRVSKLAGKTIGSEMYGWYFVVGYDILPMIAPGSEQALIPFVQFEKLNTQSAVPAGFTAAKANDRSTVSFGVNYKPHPNVALKFDYRKNKNEALTGVDQWNLAVNYLF